MSAPFVYNPDADIEDRCQIYLGRHEESKLYTRGVLAWFHNNSEWFVYANPSDEEIIRQLTLYVLNTNAWTDNPNKADCWNGYWIDKFQKFLLAIEWRKAILKTVPLDSD
jgi:hypothetical protein